MKPIPWIFAPDVHGDKIDRNAEKALFEVMKFFKPQIRIQGGDLFDIRCLRRGAGSEEALEDLREDIDAGVDFIDRFRPTHWLRGNHDERLFDATNSHNPILRRYASLEYSNITDHLEKAGCKQILPYSKRHGVLKFGHLIFVHGFSAGIYAAKKHAEIYNNVVFGHTHAIDSYSIPSLEERKGWNVGSLCLLDMDYNRMQLNTLRQRHGFAYGFFYPNGDYRLFQAEEICGRWLFPTEFKEYKP